MSIFEWFTQDIKWLTREKKPEVKPQEKKPKKKWTVSPELYNLTLAMAFFGTIGLLNSENCSKQ